jgi:E3 ubiquitin-protein ligase RNF216
VLRSDSEPVAQDGVLPKWETAVLNCFPDICPDFLKTHGPDHAWDPQRIITHLLDEQEKGHSYPKRPNQRKRKRPTEDEEKGEDEEEEMRRKFEKADPRLASKGRDYVKRYTKTA